MSVDVSVHLYFPLSNAAAALQATRKVLRKRKFVLGIQVVTADGQTVRLPVSCVSRSQVDVTGLDGKERMVEVPTISPVFPEVIGPEPLFALEELTRLSSLECEIAYREGGKVVDSLPVGFYLERGQDYLGLSFSSIGSAGVGDFYTPRFRSWIEYILAHGEGVAAVYQGMGEWSSFADYSTINDPGSQAETAGIDAFVAFLVKNLAGPN